MPTLEQTYNQLLETHTVMSALRFAAREHNMSPWDAAVQLKVEDAYLRCHSGWC